MARSSEPVDWLLWLPLLVPAYHITHLFFSLPTAPWDGINLQIEGLCGAAWKLAVAAVHALAKWSPSPLMKLGMLLWAIIIAAQVLKRSRRARDRSSYSKSVGE